jgi:starch-binding outer membrane protein, SusD/RagB family
MKINKIYLVVSIVLFFAACTKLDTKLNDSITPTSGGGSIGSPQALLNNTYNSLATPLNNQDQIFSLMENTTDECLVPTRGGDWDDNGVWRVLHSHSWDVTHSQSQSVFLNLGSIESNATTVLASGPLPEQAAQAIFLRSFAQYYYVNLYGQVPYRTVEKYNSIDAPPVLSAKDAVDTLVTNLTAIIPLLSYTATSTGLAAPYKASPDAARFLLMKVLLNKQAFLNRQSPAAAVAADMAQVVALGQAIIGSGKYTLTPHYFDNFGPNNGGTSPGYGFGVGTEAIFSFPNQKGVSSHDGINSVGTNARWMMGLHYNSYGHPGQGVYGGAGWNGFSTVADFYNSFGASDTMRKGNVYYPGVTNKSGLKVGLVQGPQLDELGANRKDRNGANLTFNTTVSLVEPNPATLEDDGVRIMKYPPDYENYTGGQQGNQLQIFRYADVYLMMAEAQLRQSNAAAALLLVNQLRAARLSAPLATLTLVNSSNLYDPNTLLSERQKEMYWESWRREDLIRFGVFLQPWALKTADDPKYLLFPIPSTQLVANPNLKQNAGF